MADLKERDNSVLVINAFCPVCGNAPKIDPSELISNNSIIFVHLLPDPKEEHFMIADVPLGGSVTILAVCKIPTCSCGSLLTVTVKTVSPLEAPHEGLRLEIFQNLMAMKYAKENKL
ncbi:MAG: hypothetical protein M1338_05975 [Patescibacteria group bacterium]|nr:hypothetical protein [Patescibacteria group bacterium]